MAKSLTITIQDDVKATWLMDGFIQGKNWTEQVPNPNYDPVTDIPNPAYDDQIAEDPVTNPSTIPNPNFDDVVEIANPITKLTFLKMWIIEQIRVQAVIGHTQIANATETDEAFNNIVID